MKLIFVRHGQTDFNKKGVMQGQEFDPPLNERGVQQVQETRAMLLKKGWVISAIISSPLQRALQTAQIVNEMLRKDILIDERLQEFSYGSLAGKTWVEIADETGDRHIREKELNLTFDYRAYGGESAAQVKARVADFIEEARANYGEKEVILATSHEGVIDVVRLISLGSRDKVAVDNATIHEFDFPD